MELDFDPYLRVGDVSVGERDVALLRAVGRNGSLNAAASDLGRSYSRAHRRLSTLEDAVGPLVDRQRGGAGGGGSDLTATARTLIERYEDLADALSGTASTPHATLEGTVTDREGELVTVETPAGPVRAIATDDADRVRVRFPADAVTLHAPAATPAESETSARNRFDGTIRAIDVGDATAAVTVDVGASAPLVVTITRASQELLALEPGAVVVATVKATAARARSTMAN